MPFYQGFLYIVSCGPSQYEKENVAALIFSIMSETKILMLQYMSLSVTISVFLKGEIC